MGEKMSAQKKEEKKLSKREAEILDWIMHRIRCYKTSPNNKDIRNYFEVSHVVVSNHLQGIIKKGYLKRNYKGIICANVSKYWYNKNQKGRKVFNEAKTTAKGI